MNYKKTDFKDLIICQPTLFKDSRGYFYESFHAKHFKDNTGIDIDFVQENQSLSKYGVVRGLHLQVGDFAQAKLVRCIFGKILDVVVDMRQEEPTFGNYFSIELSEENHTQLFIPRGFAHGFSVLSTEAVFSYKCDNYYHKESEIAVAYNDTHFNIDWKIPQKDQILSEKDKNGLAFAKAIKQL